MSLSPDDYKRSLGIARCGRGTCLVYLGKLLGETPCGCDNWPLVERDGLIWTDFPGHPNEVFPPYGTQEEREEYSRVLHTAVARIRWEYLRGKSS